jgi:hypothetical protein
MPFLFACVAEAMAKEHRLIALPEASFGRSRSAELTSKPHGSASRDKLEIFDLPSASTFVNMFNILTGFILIRLLHTFLGVDFARVVYK